MKNDFVAHFIVKNGFPEYRNPAYLANMQKFEGCHGQVVIKKKWSKRSLNQNSLYWIWIDVIAQTFGYTSEEMHVVIKGLLGFKKEVIIKGKRYRIPRSTTSYSKGEMVDYMFEVERWANQEGITLPHPEDLSLPQLIDEDE